MLFCAAALLALTACNGAQCQEEDSIILLDPITYDPEFPGGVDSLRSFISRNLKRPSSHDTTGLVYVRLVIESDGSVSDATVLRSLNKECDEEALRVVKMMPTRWKPAYLQFEDHPIRCDYFIPIRF